MYTRIKNKGIVAIGVALLCSLAVLGACSPSAASPEDLSSTGATEEAATSQAVWSIDQDCAMCHESEQASMADSTCMASFHAAVECATCHADADGSMTSAHEGATADKVSSRVKLKETKVDMATCQSCHAADELASKTADVDVLTDNNGTTVNPHALPEGGDHTGIDCFQCHSVHDPKAKTEVNAEKTCRNCHHQNVYECYTCHE